MGVLLFIASFILVPAIHTMHHDDCDHAASHTTSHDPDTCAICAVATMALVAPCPHIAAWIQRESTKRIDLLDSLLITLLTPHTHPARAPPVA